MTFTFSRAEVQFDKLITLTKNVTGPPQPFLTETKRGFLRENNLFLLPANLLTTTDKGYTLTDVYFSQ